MTNMNLNMVIQAPEPHTIQFLDFARSHIISGPEPYTIQFLDAARSHIISGPEPYMAPEPSVVQYSITFTRE